MQQELTIRQVAEITGLSAHTLRYYERIGLLESVNRTSSGYRTYDAANIAWIEFLNRLRENGMSIRQMQKFSVLRNQGSVTVRERRILLEQHRDIVKNHLAKLEQNLKTIEDKITYYKELEEKNNDQ